MKKPCQRVQARGDEALAVMSFEEIGSALGISRAAASNACVRAVKKLRRNVVATEHMLGLAVELERNRPVDVDWFGGEDQ
jgi:hypothetical protein